MNSTCTYIFLFDYFIYKFIAGSALWCYECVSTQPGCGREFNWLLHWTTICPEDDDICVKIIETKGSKGIIFWLICFIIEKKRKHTSWILKTLIYNVIHFAAEEIITRSCLSSLKGIRTDIPADHYEGCRPGAVDLNLGHYVNNSIKELDIHRNQYKATWCFCFLDHRCNSASSYLPSLILTVSLTVLLFFQL